MQLSTKNQSIMLQVLSGKYPEYEITKMNKESLERFVQQLVKRTCKVPSENGEDCKFRKPKWWPKDVVFKNKLHFPRDSVIYVRPILKQLVIKCSEYFRNGPFKQKWLPDPGCDNFLKKKENENDENLFINVINRGTKRKNPELINNNNHSPKKLKLNQIKSKCDIPPSEIPECFKACYVAIEPNFILIPNQKQFLGYFGLNSTNDIPNLLSTYCPSHLSLLKLSSCPQVPFSSNVGRAMTVNENYTMPEELKLRRLEKTEWYLSGKSGYKPTDQEYEVTYTRRCGDSDDNAHEYRFPKRQYHQYQPPLYLTPFVWERLQSCFVKVERLDLTKVQKKLRVYVKRMHVEPTAGPSTACREVKVVVARSEISDTESNSSIRRYSPRLRSL